MPIDEYVAHDLLAWYEVTPYKKPSDYAWATDANRARAKRGKQPVWLSAVYARLHSTLSSKTGDHQEDVVAHISPLFRVPDYYRVVVFAALFQQHFLAPARK
jgi:hypothetical protein